MNYRELKKFQSEMGKRSWKARVKKFGKDIGKEMSRRRKVGYEITNVSPEHPVIEKNEI